MLKSRQHQKDAIRIRHRACTQTSTGTTRHYRDLIAITDSHHLANLLNGFWEHRNERHIAIILDIDPLARSARLQPGVRNLAISARVALSGLKL